MLQVLHSSRLVYISQQGKNWKINGHSYYLSWNQQFAQWNLMVFAADRCEVSHCEQPLVACFYTERKVHTQGEPPPHLGSLGGSPTRKEWPRKLSRIWGSSGRVLAPLPPQFKQQKGLSTRKSWSVSTCHGLTVKQRVGSGGWASTGTTGTTSFSLSWFIRVHWDKINAGSGRQHNGIHFRILFFKEGHRLWPGAFGIVYVWWSVTWDGWHQWSMFVGRIIPLSKWLGSSQGVSHNKKSIWKTSHNPILSRRKRSPSANEPRITSPGTILQAGPNLCSPKRFKLRLRLMVTYHHFHGPSSIKQNLKQVRGWSSNPYKSSPC